MNKKRSIAIILLSLGCVIGSIAWIRAQVSPSMAVMHSANHPTNRSRPKVSATHGMVAQVAKQLGLSPEQEQKVEKIVEASQPQMEAIHSDKSLTPQKQMDKMNGALKEVTERVNKVLTPAQRAQFKEMVATMHTEHAHH